MKLSVSIDIRSTPERVFYWLGDPDRAMQWMESVTRYEIIDQTPDMVGTTFREYMQDGERETEMRGIVTEYVPNKSFGMHLESDYHIVDVRHNLEENGDITQVSQEAEISFKGFMKVIMLFLWPLLKRNITQQSLSELAKLKELCEQDI